jgi:hypothetical protein
LIRTLIDCEVKSERALSLIQTKTYTDPCWMILQFNIPKIVASFLAIASIDKMIIGLVLSPISNDFTSTQRKIATRKYNSNTKWHLLYKSDYRQRKF